MCVSREAPQNIQYQNDNEVCNVAEDSRTHNKELAEDVLIESPPAAGAEGFAENIVKPREIGYS